jgi:hypothetical protein
LKYPLVIVDFDGTPTLPLPFFFQLAVYQKWCDIAGQQRELVEIFHHVDDAIMAARLLHPVISSNSIKALARKVVLALVESSPGNLYFYPGVIDSTI